MSPQFTERQAKAWSEAVAEIQRYVTSTVSADIDHYDWTVSWKDETRPGRGHGFVGLWCDGEHLAQVVMDVYGYPSVAVAEVTWLHNSEADECDCDPCTAERAENGEQ